MNRPFFEALKAIYPDDRLLTRDVELLPYESDALTAFQTKPGAVALPVTEDEIIDTVRLCHKMKVPLWRVAAAPACPVDRCRSRMA